MRRLGALCLCLGLTAPAFATEPPAAEETPSIPWYRWLFLGERSKPATPKKELPPSPAPINAEKAGPLKETAKESAAKQLAAEHRVYLQRAESISKIRKIADQQNDEAMLKRADELDQQAWDIYVQRTAGLMTIAEREDRAALERGKDNRPATADSSPRRRTTGGNDR